MRHFALILSAVVVLMAPASALASSEGPAVRVALSMSPSQKGSVLRAVLMNRTDAVVSGSVELMLPDGISLRRGPARFEAALASKGVEVHTFDLVASRGIETSAVELRFIPSANQEGYSRGRLFVSGGADRLTGMTTEQAIEAESLGTDETGHRLFAASRLPRSLDAPVPNPAGDAAVKGRLTWYGHSGALVPGAHVKVELVPPGGGAAVATGLTERDGSFQVSAGDGEGAVKARFTLGNDRWLLKKGRKAYSWESPELTLVEASVIDAGEIVLPKGLPSSEAAWIHGTLSLALQAFSDREIDISWWNQVGINWPARGDYYSWGEVNLTEPYQWDVIGHEFGHAVFHIGSNSRSSGGQHKIDECYAKTLAWSEGFATFFAAVCHLDRNDPDAKFQFLVPRRAPIRLENVPADVCESEKNEWRVGSALWDLYDLHGDGTDSVAYDFDRIWKWMRDGNRMASLSDYWAVVRQDLPAAEREAALQALEQSRVDLQ